MCDFCALSPAQRKLMLDKFHRILKPGGAVLLDVYSLSAFADRQEAATYEKNQLNSFWSPDPYYGFVNTFKYDEEKVIIDKYTIIEPDRSRTIYNWLQYFSVESITEEFAASNLTIESVYANACGHDHPPNAPEFAIVARK